MSIANPVNGIQRQFSELCDLGGGVHGGPARTKVQQLLRESGQQLNAIAEEEIAQNLAEYADCNPWHLCFAVSLSWGHLAQLDLEFTGAAVRLLAHWNNDDLEEAKQFCNERGPSVIEQSLSGGYQMFQSVKLPDDLPDDLEKLGKAQQRWLGRILSPDRPRYIGSWNATAMFMVALFAKPDLADQLTTPAVLLPPGGPITRALSILYQTSVLPNPPAGSDLDDDAFEPGALYENNEHFAYLLKGLGGWNLVDVHSGLYMLGTGLASSDHWF